MVVMILLQLDVLILEVTSGSSRGRKVNRCLHFHSQPLPPSAAMIGQESGQKKVVIFAP